MPYLLYLTKKSFINFPSSGINGRLELRCLDAGGTVLEGIQRIIRLLDGACTRENYDALIQDQTDKLRAEWARMRARRLSVPHCTPLWLDNNRLRIISTEQLYALLYELRPGIDAHALVRRYNAARDENERLTRCNLVSFDKLTKYVTLLRKHLYLYARKYKYSLSQLPKCNKKPLKADQGKERLSENSDDELFR